MLDEDLAVAELGARANITTISDYAHMGRGRVAELLKVAKVRADKARTYDVYSAIVALAAFSDAGKSLGKQIGADALDDDDSAIGRNSHLAALASARAKSEEARARKLEIEVATKEKSLVSREAVTRAAVQYATHIRNGLLGFPARVAHKLVGAADAEAIERILDDEMRDALAELGDADRYCLGEI